MMEIAKLPAAAPDPDRRSNAPRRPLRRIKGKSQRQTEEQDRGGEDTGTNRRIDVTA